MLFTKRHVCKEPTTKPALSGGSSPVGADITSHYFQSGERIQVLESNRAKLVDSQVLVPTITTCDQVGKVAPSDGMVKPLGIKYDQ